MASLTLDVIDYHVAGEPLRLVKGVWDIEGADMAAKAKAALVTLRQERALASAEPRAHRDIFVAFLTKPVTPEASFGVLICDGEPDTPFKSACGHGTIAVAVALLEEGLIRAQEGQNRVVLDLPAGQITLLVDFANGRAGEVLYQHVETSILLEYASFGGFDGTLVNAGPRVFLLNAWGIGPNPKAAFAAYRKIVETTPADEAPHLVQFVWPQGREGFRSFTFFGASGYDRSPCGTGSSALAAWAVASGKHPEGAWFTNMTLLDTCFQVRALDLGEGRFRPEIRASAYLTGRSNLILQPDDPLPQGIIPPDFL